MTSAKEDEHEYEITSTPPRARQRSGTYLKARPEDIEASGGRMPQAENHVGRHIRDQLIKVLHSRCNGVQKELLKEINWPESQKGVLSNIIHGERNPDLRSLYDWFGYFGTPTEILVRADRARHMRKDNDPGMIAKLGRWDEVQELALEMGTSEAELERWGRCFVAMNSKLPRNFLTKVRTSRDLDVDRLIGRLEKKLPRLSQGRLWDIVLRTFPRLLREEFASVTSEKLARQISPATTIQVVSELPAPWVHDALNFNVFVRDTRDAGLNEHRSCEALLAYALGQEERILLSHECDMAVWRLISVSAHPDHRELRREVYSRCLFLTLLC